MSTAASHVIAATILLDVLAAAGTLLHEQSQGAVSNEYELLRHWLRALLLRNPLMLADEAHGCVKAQVCKTNAAEDGAIYLQFSGKEVVLHQVAPALQLGMANAHRLRQMADGLPKASGYGDITVGSEASGSCRSLDATEIKLRLQPTCPALLAHLVVASGTFPMRSVAEEPQLHITAHEASGPRIRH